MKKTKKTKKALLYFITILISFLIFSNNKVKEYLKNIYYDSNLATKIENFKLGSSGLLIHNNEMDKLEDSHVTYNNIIIDPTFYPYYNLLTEQEQDFYKQLYANILSYQKAFKPNVSLTRKDTLKVIEAVYEDHPEFFYLDSNFSYKYTKDDKCVQIILNYNETLDNIESSLITFESKVNEIVRVAKNLETDYEKEKYVHDILVKNIKYQENPPLDQSAYGALIGNEAVCAGYSRAFQYIMQKLGIPTYYVSGYSDDGNLHAWNIVLLSGSYYNVDITWDDSNNNYEFFNIGDTIFSQNHIRDGLSKYLPSCPNESYHHTYEHEEKHHHN